MIELRFINRYQPKVRRNAAGKIQNLNIHIENQIKSWGKIMDKVKNNNTYVHTDPNPKKQEKKDRPSIQKEKPEITNIPEDVKKIKISESNPLISYSKKRDATQTKRIDKNLKNTEQEIISNKKNNIDKNSENKIETAEELIGKSIKPEVAIEYLDAFNFDHLGNIISTKINAKKLKIDDLQKLNNSIITDLAKTNSPGSRDAARTNREIILDLICELDQVTRKPDKKEITQINALKKISQNLKSLWLSSEIGSSSTENTLLIIGRQLSILKLNNLSRKAKELAIEASKTKHFTQKQDNAFGRKFESEFVYALIKNPPKSILIAADKIGNYLKNLLLKIYNDSDISNALKNLAKSLESDPRPWHAETPEIQQFIKDPSKLNFEKLMTNESRTGYEVIKQTFVGVKLSLVIDGPWMLYANYNYQQIIKKARSTMPSLLGNFTKRTPVISTEFQSIINTNPNLMKQANLKLKPVKELLNLLNAKPTYGNALVFFIAIKNLIKDDFPDLKSAAEEIITSLENGNPDSYLELTSERLTPEENTNLFLNGINANLEKTDGFGTSLPHHLPNKGGENWGSGANIQASVHVNVNEPTKFEENTLNSEQNTVNGASGSTNVMTFLYRYMLQNPPENDKEPPINIQDAFAGTMMFLTFDGGHSLPESFGTFNSILLNDPVLSGTSLTAEYEKEYIKRREKTLQNFNLEYQDIPKMFQSKDTAEATQNAIDTAFAETTKLFSEVHSQRIIDE